MSKKFILNADNFGMSKAANHAVAEACETDFLKSVSLSPNGDAFDEAVNEILPKCPDLDVGIHLNITQGKSLCADLNLLTDANRNFCNSYFKILIMAFNPVKNEFLTEVEREFRRQIETVLAKVKVSHIDSNKHIHAIPPIFDMVCRLAKEYGIPQVRTHFEKFYYIPDIYKHMSKLYFRNFFKKFILNLMTIFNENTVIKYGLKTNDYTLGIGYASMMDSLALSYGINVLKYDNITVEAVVNPCRYEEGTIDNYFDEYLITKNKKLKDKIIHSGYDITNYKKPQEENTEPE